MIQTWELESPHELGFKKDEKYWIQGWSWMKLIEVKKTILSSGRIAFSYIFEGCEP